MIFCLKKGSPIGAVGGTTWGDAAQIMSQRLKKIPRSTRVKDQKRSKGHPKSEISIHGSTMSFSADKRLRTHEELKEEMLTPTPVFRSKIKLQSFVNHKRWISLSSVPGVDVDCG